MCARRGFQGPGVNDAPVERQSRARPRPEARSIAFAYCHKCFGQTIDGRLWLNPGSCGRYGFDREFSFALLHNDGGAQRVEKIVLRQ